MATGWELGELGGGALWILSRVLREDRWLLAEIVLGNGGGGRVDIVLYV